MNQLPTYSIWWPSMWINNLLNGHQLCQGQPLLHKLIRLTCFTQLPDYRTVWDLPSPRPARSWSPHPRGGWVWAGGCWGVGRAECSTSEPLALEQTEINVNKSLRGVSSSSSAAAAAAAAAAAITKQLVKPAWSKWVQSQDHFLGQHKNQEYI